MVKASHLKLVEPHSADTQKWIDDIAARESAAAANTLREVLAFVTPLYEAGTLPGGEAILPHVLDTVLLLRDLNLGHEAVAAALLWPMLELDAGAAKRVRDKFGADISGLAEGVLRMSAMGALSSKRGGSVKPEEQAAQLESAAQNAVGDGAGRARGADQARGSHGGSAPRRQERR